MERSILLQLLNHPLSGFIRLLQIRYHLLLLLLQLPNFLIVFFESCMHFLVKLIFFILNLVDFSVHQADLVFDIIDRSMLKHLFLVAQDLPFEPLYHLLIIDDAGEGAG